MAIPDRERILRILAEAARHRSLVPFVGAGASKAAGLPTWNELVAPLAKDVGAGKDDDVLDVPQWYVDQHGREALERQVTGALSIPAAPAPLHWSVARLGSPVLCTTNYDQLMERAIEEIDRVPPDVIIEDGHVGLIDEARRTTLVKLHGCLTVPDTIVLTRDDYEAYAERHRAMTAYLQSLLATRTFLFVGFSLTDINFRTIYNAIGRALGPHRRTAYVLTYGKWSDPMIRYWRSKGVETAAFVDGDAQAGFVGEIAQRASAVGDALGSARALAAVLPIAPLVAHLEGAHATLREMIDVARHASLLPDPSEPGVEGGADTDESATASDAQPQVRSISRAILHLASVIDAAVPLDDPMDWVSIGELLYEDGDAAGAIQAYQAALRPSRGSRVRLDPATVRRVRGNLGRAYARERHFGRSEWLLRRCVFLKNQELPEGPGFTRRSVSDRLDRDALESRPTDASELVYAMTRLAERLLDDQRPRQAFELMREARYILEPLLGIQKDAGVDAVDLFADREVGRRRPWRGRDLPDHPYVPKAWALNFFGKAYRLSAQAAQSLGRNDVVYYAAKADGVLHDASKLDRLLRHPYEHRLAMQRELRLAQPQRQQLAAGLRADITKLGTLPDGRRVIGQLRSQFPDSRVWR
jgi:tetratricopeptide (TPR) repeat protein